MPGPKLQNLHPEINVRTFTRRLHRFYRPIRPAQSLSPILRKMRRRVFMSSTRFLQKVIIRLPTVVKIAE